MTYPVLAHIGVIFVGGVFLLTGIMKVLEPWLFTKHVRALGLLQPHWVQPVSVAFIGVEAALGMALISGVGRHILIPLTIVVVIALSILTYWSISTGKTKDCGCYNGRFQISPTISLFLNAFFIFLLAGGWFFVEAQPAVLWKWLLTLVTLIATGGLAWRHLKYFNENYRPFLDFWGRLKVSVPWESRWLGKAVDVSIGSRIVVFLGIECPLCKNWLPVLKVVHHRADLPEVLGVVSATTALTAQEYAQSHSLNFPIVLVDHNVVDELVLFLPTAVVLEDGVIKEKWVGKIPREFAERVALGPMLIPDGTGEVLIGET